MQFLGYLFFRLFVLLFALVPFWLVYRISDALAFLFYNVLTYRKKIVLKNLEQSFPEKLPAEIRKIAKAFYRNFSDLLVEGLKGFSQSKSAMMKRYTFSNVQLLDRFKSENRSVILTASHYGNWEWGALTGGLHLPHNCIGLYKPLTNTFTDAYMRKKRSKWDMTLVSIYETAKAFIQNKDKANAYIMVADQSPSKKNKQLWLPFLNQETSFLVGPEKYANRLDLPVVFLDIQRLRRGYYDVEIRLISENPKTEKDGFITTKYAELVESQIQKKPENWLWSHKRWKLKRP